MCYVIIDPFLMSIINRTVFVLLLLSLSSDVQTVVIISPGTKISASLGETVNLTCYTSVVVREPQSFPNTYSITWKFGREVLSDGVSTILSQGVSFLNIEKIKSGQAGSYSCEAVIYYKVLNVIYGLTYVNTTNIIVQLPSVNDPVLSPFPFIDTYYSGIEVTFQCIFSVDINAINNDPDANVITNWKKGDTILTSDSRITVDAAKLLIGSYDIFTILLKFEYLTEADSSNYRCEVFVTSSVDNDFVVETSASSTLFFTVNAPTLDVNLTSTSVYLSDLDDYNNISLTCTATLPLSIELKFPKVFRWTKDGTDITTSDNDPTDPKGVVSVSTLNTIMKNAGVFVFKCEVSINVPGDPVVTNSSTLAITVLSPTNPNKPSELKAHDVRYNKATVQWTVSILAYDPEKYVVYYGTDESSLTSNSSAVYSIKNSSRINETYSVTLTDLVYDTVYYYQVESTNSHGTATSDTNSFKTKEGPPTAPLENFTISVISSTALNMSWNPPPEEFRNGAITNYILTCNETVGDVSQLVNSSFPMLITQNDSVSIVCSGFRPGTLITCSVSASNHAGTGPPATASATTDEERPGGTPENFIILSRTSRSFNLSWSPPDPFLQNGAILGYTLTCREKLSGTVPSSYPRTNYPHPPPLSVVADDLRPFTEYTCNLTAVNSAGSSDPAIDSSTTEQDTPTAPPDNFIISVISSTALNMSWNPPPKEYQNGAITNYTLTCNETVGDVSQLVNSSFPMLITQNDSVSIVRSGFRPGTLITCSVSASNHAGTGPPATSSATTDEERPGGSPEDLVIFSRTSRSFILSWSSPDPFLQNGVILGYTLTCGEKLSGTVPSSYPRTNYPHPPPSSVVADDLRPFTEYTCNLTAVNSAGSSDPAIDSSTTGQEAPDGRPTDFKVSQTSSRSLTLTWRPIDPLLQNGVITNYTLKCNSSMMYPIQVSPDDNKEVSNGEYNILIQGLIPGTTYQCTVYANTSKGAGPEAVVIRRTFEERPGSVPLSVSLSTESSTSVLVTWLPPELPYGVITHYTVYVTRVSCRNDTSMSTNVIGRLKYSITGLSPYQLVKVQISAHTAIGEGPRSDREEGRSEESAPDIIRGIKFTASSHTELVVAIPVKQDISVARGVITRFYCSIISYTGDNPLQEESFPTNDNGIYCVDVEYLSDIDREDLQNITFKELVPEKPYNVSVHAINSAGNGTSNLVIVFSQQGRPPAPKYVTAEVINGTAIIVYWQKIDITEARGHISGYVVSYSLDSEKIESQELTEKKTVGPDENQAVLSDLRKGGTYRVSVSAFNPNGDVGDASYSEPIILLATTESKGSSVAVIVPIVCVLVILITIVAVILLVFFLRRLHQRFVARRSVNLKTNLSSEKRSQVLSDIVMTKSPAYERNVFCQQSSEVSNLETNPAYVAINREFHLYEKIENFHQPSRPQSTCCEYEIPQR